MAKLSWGMKLGIGLLAVSGVVYLVKFLVLGDPLNTYLYVFNSLGFLPINVLFVTLIINQLLSIRAKRERMEKLNMIIGTFYSEVGISLLGTFSQSDSGMKAISRHLVVGDDWTDREFSQMLEMVKNHTFPIDITSLNLTSLQSFLSSKRDFMLRLLENPILLEHSAFTETLQAVFHLAEEMTMRTSLEGLPKRDIDHLRGDVMRVYSQVAWEWVAYMKYLKREYPYLFSLAMRRNPFDASASIVLRE